MKKLLFVLLAISSLTSSSYAKERSSEKGEEKERTTFIGIGLGAGTSISNPNGRGTSYHIQFNAGAQVHEASHLNIGIFLSNYGRTARSGWGFLAYDHGYTLGPEISFRNLFNSGLFAGLRVGVAQRELTESFLGLFPGSGGGSGYAFTGGPVIGYDFKFKNRFAVGVEMSSMYLSSVPITGYWTGDGLYAEWIFSGLANFKVFF